jgi:hypothetical protein
MRTVATGSTFFTEPDSLILIVRPVAEMLAALQWVRLTEGKVDASPVLVGSFASLIMKGLSSPSLFISFASRFAHLSYIFHLYLSF